MDAYEHLYNAPDINMIIDTINEMFNKKNKDMFTVCHGRYHAMFVIGTIENILNSLSYDIRTVELGKIAALLHDIGNIAGRWNHERKSAVLAKVMLDGSNHLSEEEKDIIIQAIDDHSSAINISSAVGAALIIADKVDWSKNRLLPVKGLRESGNVLLEVDKVDLDISKKIIIINFITTNSFIKEQFMKEYKNAYNCVLKGAKFLGCACQLRFNGIEENFAL